MKNREMQNDISPIYQHRNFQVIYMSIILILFFLKFFIALQSFNAHEQSPPLFPNLPDKQQPFGHGVTPGLFIKNMTEFNIQEDTFSTE
jgi:hypothetical protein